MRILALTAVCFFAIGCSTEPTKYNYLPIQGPPPFKPTEVKEQTAEQKENDKKESEKYFAALFETIESIDDGVTSPDVIARACVSKNVEKLRQMKAARIAHFNTTEAARVNSEKLLSECPTQSDINSATFFVLRYRKLTSKNL